MITLEQIQSLDTKSKRSISLFIEFKDDKFKVISQSPLEIEGDAIDFLNSRVDSVIKLGYRGDGIYNSYVTRDKERYVMVSQYKEEIQ